MSENEPWGEGEELYQDPPVTGEKGKPELNLKKLGHSWSWGVLLRGRD